MAKGKGGGGKQVGGNLGGIMMMAIGMVFIAVGFIMFPNITTATDAILAYTYSANNTITDATFTGLTAVTGITPLLCLLGYLSVAVISGFMGYKVMQSGGSMTANPASFLMLGISLVFIAMALYIFPVLLDGCASVLHGGGAGISSSYAGLQAIIGLSPMLVLIAFDVATVVMGMFGLKTMTN